MRLSANQVMQVAAQIKTSQKTDIEKAMALQILAAQYRGRGKSGKRPRTFSGVARAKRQAKKLHNAAKH